MASWLVKEEPEHYPYEQLERDGRTVWAGVRNALAQRHLGSMRRGDRVLYYHTGKVRAVVGLARVASDPYPDPGDPAGRRVAVDLEPVRKLARPIALAAIKADPALASFPLVRISRLSVMPVSEKEWRRLVGDAPSPTARRATAR